MLRAVVLVSGVRHSGPYAAYHHIRRFRIAIFIDLVLGVSDLDHVTQVSGMRIAVEVFITAHRSSPPQNIFSGSRYGYSRLSKAIRVAL